MDSSVLSVGTSTRTSAHAGTVAVHWQLAAVVFAATSVIVGLIWDISWHMSIGRDTFWTPAHLAIYTGGAVAGLASGAEVLRRSVVARGPHGDGVTVWRVFNGPLGGWLCIWGAVAMLTSGPFDDWWHDAYGLDVKIISPPHALLALGFVAILAGAMLLAVSRQAREAPDRIERSGAAWLVAYTFGIHLTMVAIFTTEYQDRVLMHSGIFYAVAALVFPCVLVAAARTIRLRHAALATAAIYTLVMCTQLWILPLFPATPLLGPIRQQVTHMVPLSFPLLLIVPAAGTDFVMARTRSRGSWVRAVVLGVVFVVLFVASQWPFAEFLMHGPSQNAFFRTDNFAFMVPPDWLGPRRRFLTESPAATMVWLAVALVASVLSARAGLAWGGWLRTVRR